MGERGQEKNPQVTENAEFEFGEMICKMSHEIQTPRLFLINVKRIYKMEDFALTQKFGKFLR